MLNLIKQALVPEDNIRSLNPLSKTLLWQCGKKIIGTIKYAIAKKKSTAEPSSLRVDMGQTCVLPYSAENQPPLPEVEVSDPKA